MWNDNSYRVATFDYGYRSKNIDKAITDHLIALDTGYSGIKYWTPFRYGQFPTFAIPREGQRTKSVEGSEIQLQDLETGRVWLVGEAAIGQSGFTDDTYDLNTRDFYSKDHFRNPAYRACVRAGLALSVLRNQFGTGEGKKLRAICALPPDDFNKWSANQLKKALAYTGDVEIMAECTKGKFQKVHIDLKEEDIIVLSQPMGLFYSALFAANGAITDGTLQLTKRNVLIWDAGYMTFDRQAVLKGRLNESMSFTARTATHEILKETAAVLTARTGLQATVDHLKSSLDTGEWKVRVPDETGRFHVVKEPFCEILDRKREEVFQEVIDRELRDLNGLMQFEDVIVGGGTMELWRDLVERLAAEMELRIHWANEFDTEVPLSMALSRGLFYYLVMIRKRELEKCADNK